MRSLQEDLFSTLKQYTDIFDAELPIWDIMRDLNNLIQKLVEQNRGSIHRDAFVHDSAVISNSYIGKNVQVYEGCTVRDSIILDNTVIGHASEVARSLLLVSCFVPRFNYVGGSFLGERVHLGGSVMLATRRHDEKAVVIHWGEERIKTDLLRFGSIVGDDVTISFNSHVNPGTVIGKNSLIMPLVDVRGYIPANSLVVLKQSYTVMKRRTFPDLEALDNPT